MAYKEYCVSKPDASRLSFFRRAASADGADAGLANKSYMCMYMCMYML
jgi:hypothetical protein